MTLPSCQLTRRNCFLAWDAERKNLDVVSSSSCGPVRVPGCVIDLEKWRDSESLAIVLSKERTKTAQQQPPPNSNPNADARRDRLLAQKLLDHVLGDRAPTGWDRCAHCSNRPTLCAGPPCRADFDGTTAAAAEAAIELRPTGDAAVGLGVFVRPGASLRAGQWLGEYAGEVVAAGGPVAAGGVYCFGLGPRLLIDAGRFGTWSRFVNHACAPNVDARAAVVGGRRGVFYRARRALGPGEELTVHYGADYFVGLRKKCRCAAAPLPHAVMELPWSRGLPAIVENGAVAAEKAAASEDDCPDEVYEGWDFSIKT